MTVTISPSSEVARSPRALAMAPIGMIAAILLLHIVGWGGLFAVLASGTLGANASAFSVGIGLTAYVLGVRHAFDADHIAAIDNTTRKLLQEGQRPRSVGFWFSCGHSTIVFLLTLLLAFGVRALANPVVDDGSQLHRITGLIGTIVSGGFLYAIAALNIVVLADIWSVFKRMRSGAFDEAELECRLENRGVIIRLIGRIAGLIRKPWQMYAVGLLFGLGFDTATEIALLVLATSSAATGLPWYAVLCLPILFAAGMSLFDTLQGAFMTAAYEWALVRPVRRIYYNLVVTGISVTVALCIGTIEIVGLIGERFDFHGWFWDTIASLDLNTLGFAIAGLFVLTWFGAVTVWKCGKIDDRCCVTEGD